MMRAIRFWEGIKKMFSEGLDKLHVEKALIRFQLANNPHVSPPAVSPSDFIHNFSATRAGL